MIENRYIKKILSYTRKAVDDYDMISKNDRIAIGVSGGKDSMTLLCALNNLREFYPRKYTIVALCIDLSFEMVFSEAKNTNFNAIIDFCKENDIELYFKKTQIAEIIFNERKEKNPCSLCARMRRGALHDLAIEHGCNKLALGHHFDDICETFMMNLLFEGRFGSFSPVTYLSRKDMTVIRPLMYLAECSIKSFVDKAEIPIICSCCPMDKTSKRAEIKGLLAMLNKDYHDIKFRIFHALQKSQISGFKLSKMRKINDNEQNNIQDE